MSTKEVRKEVVRTPPRHSCVVWLQCLLPLVQRLGVLVVSSGTFSGGVTTSVNSRSSSSCPVMTSYLVQQHFCHVHVVRRTAASNAKRSVPQLGPGISCQPKCVAGAMLFTGCLLERVAIRRAGSSRATCYLSRYCTSEQEAKDSITPRATADAVIAIYPYQVQY